MGTIFVADKFGLPVSTTHILSSGVAGTMAANGSGLRFSTLRNIAAGWIFTLPAAALLSGSLYWLFRHLRLKRRAVSSGFLPEAVLSSLKFICHSSPWDIHVESGLCCPRAYPDKSRHQVWSLQWLISQQQPVPFLMAGLFSTRRATNSQLGSAAPSSWSP